MSRTSRVQSRQLLVWNIHWIIIIIITSFSHQLYLIVFHWSLSVSKLPQVSMTLLRILINLNNAIASRVSIRPLISNSWKKSRFILSKRSGLPMIDNLLNAVHTFARRIPTSFSVDKILLPRYVNMSTNFRGSPLWVEMAPTRLNTCILFICVLVEAKYLPRAAPRYVAGIRLG